MFESDEKIALYIDGANLYAASRSLGFQMDYSRLKNYFNNEAKLLRANYYTALLEDDEFSAIRPLVDWLDYNGFNVVTKPAKEHTDSMGRKKIKGNMDIELAVDALEMVPHVDHFVIFSGDGDFRALVASLQRQGKKVTVVSSRTASPPMIADELRRQADYFIDLVDIKDHIVRKPNDNSTDNG